MKQPIVSLVGRPNVGKSTLFNRLSIDKKAIVHDIPGVTRDRKYANAMLGPLCFKVIDTPGLEESKKGKLQHKMMAQTNLAISESDIVFFIIDGREGVTVIDEAFANLIRKYNKPTLLLVNKCEKAINFDQKYYMLGFGEPVAISAEHNIGMMELYENIKNFTTIDLFDKLDSKNEAISIAIIGRPNVGKSTFINAIIRDDDRLLTGSEAGLTRESIQIEWQHKEYKINLIDTAGLRKKSIIKESLEKLSTIDAINTINFANIVIIVLDANQALEQQDLNIANYAIEQGRCVVIAVNKWDLIGREDKKSFESEFFYKLNKNLSKIQGVPVVFISAQNKQNLSKVFDECINVYKLWNKKIPTSKLNDWLNLATKKHSLPLQKTGHRIRIKYITQINTRPPTFKLFSNNPELISDSYQQYLKNTFREVFNIPGVPIRFVFAKSKNPYYFLGSK